MLQHDDKPINQRRQYGAGTFVMTTLQQSCPKGDYYQETILLIRCSYTFRITAKARVNLLEKPLKLNIFFYNLDVYGRAGNTAFTGINEGNAP
jgi:hypothetical protein